MNWFHSALFLNLKTLEYINSNAICDTTKLLKEVVSHRIFYYKWSYFSSPSDIYVEEVIKMLWSIRKI